jgi:hypothetical protein
MFASYKKLYAGMLGSTQLGMRPEQEQPNHACSVVLEKKNGPREGVACRAEEMSCHPNLTETGKETSHMRALTGHTGPKFQNFLFFIQKNMNPSLFYFLISESIF